jgi:hypothetical protein
MGQVKSKIDQAGGDVLGAHGALSFEIERSAGYAAKRLRG